MTTWEKKKTKTDKKGTSTFHFISFPLNFFLLLSKPHFYRIGWHKTPRGSKRDQIFTEISWSEFRGVLLVCLGCLWSLGCLRCSFDSPHGPIFFCFWNQARLLEELSVARFLKLPTSSFLRKQLCLNIKSDKVTIVQSKWFQTDSWGVVDLIKLTIIHKIVLYWPRPSLAHVSFDDTLNSEALFSSKQRGNENSSSLGMLFTYSSSCRINWPHLTYKSLHSLVQKCAVTLLFEGQSCIV